MSRTPTAVPILAGASGYAFDEWHGPFYPPTLKAEDRLAFYASQLPTVEINNTFYRMPRRDVLANWAAATPDGFRFAIKASRRITHLARLKAESAESLDFLYRNLDALGDKRGPVLFQLPPNLKKDLPRLEAFLGRLPTDHRAAFEFRNDSWFDDEVHALLRGAGAALCLSEREDHPIGHQPEELVRTAPWGYLRLRLESYATADLAAWVAAVRTSGWQTTYAYFMHEPTAPGYAKQLMTLAS